MKDYHGKQILRPVCIQISSAVNISVTDRGWETKCFCREYGSDK